MKMIILSKEEIQQFISTSRTRLSNKITLGEDKKNLLFESAKIYGFEIDEKKLKTLFELKNDSKINRKNKIYGAVLQIYGEYSIPSRFLVDTGSGREQIDFYIYHVTLSNRENRELAKQLMNMHAVKLFEGCDEEYLYEVLSDKSDQDFFENIKRVAPGLPIYEIVFKDDGSFKIEELGKI